MPAILPKSPESIVLWRCQGLAFPWADALSGPDLSGAALFSAKKVELKNTVDFIETMTSEGEFRETSFYEVDSVKNELNVTLQNSHRQALALAHVAGTGGFNTQVGANAGTFTVPQAKVVLADAGRTRGYYQILGADGFPVQNLSDVSIKYGKTSGAVDITLEEGVDYQIDLKTGLFWGLQQPDGFATATNLVVTYDSADVDEADDMIDIGGLSGAGQFYTLRFVGVGRGFRWRCDINKALLAGSGADLQNESATAEYELSGRCLAVSRMTLPQGVIQIPDKYRFYRLQQLMNP